MTEMGVNYWHRSTRHADARKIWLQLIDRAVESEKSLKEFAYYFQKKTFATRRTCWRTSSVAQKISDDTIHVGWHHLRKTQRSWSAIRLSPSGLCWFTRIKGCSAILFIQATQLNTYGSRWAIRNKFSFHFRPVIKIISYTENDERFSMWRNSKV